MSIKFSNDDNNSNISIIKYIVSVKHNRFYYYIKIHYLGLHVSTLSHLQALYDTDSRILDLYHSGPEDDSVRVETCSPR